MHKAWDWTIIYRLRNFARFRLIISQCAIGGEVLATVIRWRLVDNYAYSCMTVTAGNQTRATCSTPIVGSCSQSVKTVRSSGMC